MSNSSLSQKPHHAVRRLEEGVSIANVRVSACRQKVGPLGVPRLPERGILVESGRGLAGLRQPAGELMSRAVGA